MRDLDGHVLESVGITTGKANLLDSGQGSPTTVPVNPGGIPIYRGGKVVGGVGVAGVPPHFAEFAATAAAAGAGRGLDWFAGSVPLYKNGRLVGGLGVSGDGVEQDDYVSELGSEGFHPPPELRADRSVIVTGDGRIARLPYVKFPRHPEF